jgi:hypothetical protein
MAYVGGCIANEPANSNLNMHLPTPESLINIDQSLK